MPEGASRPRERDVADRLHSAAIHLLRRARRTDPLTGASPAQLSALSVLMSGPKTLGELAAASTSMNRSAALKPTMSRLASEMERVGLARKVADRSDARIVRVHATRKGLWALSRGRSMRIAAIEHLLKQLDRQEVAEIDRALGTIERVLGQRPAP